MSRMPLDEDERALALALRRSAPRGEPSAAVDAAILQASQQHVPVRRARPAAVPRRHSRWPTGIAMAAATVLALGAAWKLRMPDEPVTAHAPVAASDATAVPATPSNATDAAPPIAVYQPAAPAIPSPPPPARNPAAEPASPPAPIAPAPKGTSVARASARESSLPKAVRGMPVPARPAATIDVGQPDARTIVAGDSEIPAVNRIATERPPAETRSASKAQAAEARQAASAFPEPAVLEHVRALRVDGDLRQARIELQAWRARHPDQPLPTDLRDVLPADPR